MLSARVRDQLRSTLDLRGKAPGIASLQAASGRLKVAFGISLALYLLVKLVGVAVDLPPAVDLAVLPAGVCALGLAVSGRGVKAQEDAGASEQAAQAMAPGLMAGAVLVVFTIIYLAVNTGPIITSQDESAIVNGGHALATTGSLRVTSPLNDRYHTNIIGELHVIYRTSTEMYYRTFPGTAVLYAPFSVLPDDLGYRLFTAAFGTLAIVALYLIGWKLLRSWWGGLVGALVFAASPAFGHWAVTAYNNVPVLALELSALAVVLWSPRERTLWFGVAGALMCLAFFARITEIVFVVPVFVLVFWRTQALRPLVAFGAAGLAGVALVAITNQVFYGDPLFLPFGSGYIPLVPGSQSQAPSLQVLLGRYAQFTTSAQGSALHVSWLDKLDQIWFHVRYLASSTFAFPFLPIAFVGLAWRLVTGKRDIWLLVGAIFTVTLAILAIYGKKSGYYGFGQPIVRSSFVRYSLPIYALLSVAAGAFFLDAARVFRVGMIAVLLPFALIAIVVTVGVAHSYDSNVYGFNRLNALRQHDQAAWNRIEPFLDTDQVRPLVIGGPSAEKLIDSKYELYFINYDALWPSLRMAVLIPVAEQAAQERDVYLIASEVNPEDKQLVATLNTLYRPEQVLHAGEFRLLRLHLDPANYVLRFVDVWNTYGALDRWLVTADGYLKTTVDISYVQLLAPVDADGNGQVDQDVTIEFELLDSGPDVATISALDSRVSWRPVALWSSRLEQTGAWRTVTVSLKKGEYLQAQLFVSPGVTLRSIKVVALGTK